ncbi:MAG TPA: nucleotidyl transferase AbiEii/AbiGii toxin family protein [Phenylobacterium sp.]|nr:nucleotidyl transferase AbiEii/AbiGii toxin family protein [Phenylobacterium sp.]
MPEAFLALSDADKREALGVAATASGRPAHVLEKDVWVVWTLSALFESRQAEHLVFKGGTSLSKAYGVIDRFSEDIDITYDVRALIGDLAGTGEAPVPDNNSQLKKWRKAIDHELPAWVGGTLTPYLDARLQAQGLKAGLEPEADKLWIRHAPISEGWGYMKPDVMVEFGGRSTGLPVDEIAIVCDAAAFLEGLDFPTAKPRVMRVDRTFWEKATAVHVFCRLGQLNGERLARHWYDLMRLDDAGHAATALANRELARQVAENKQAFFGVKDIDYVAAVEGGLKLVPDGELMDRLKADYQAMVVGGLLADDAPAFEVLIERCRALEAQANGG